MAMYAFILFYVVCFVCGEMKPAAFYHSSDDIEAKLAHLSEDCPHVTLGLETTPDVDVALRSVRITCPSSRPKLPVLLFFGEHAREMITVETALMLIQILAAGGCEEASDNTDSSTGFAFKHKASTEVLALLNQEERALLADVLARADILIFPNINAFSRRSVEHGTYCLRSNPRGVDLNRNWGDHWEPGDSDTDHYGGPSAFSEPETRILRDVALAFKPQLFLTVHSGALGMFSPRAFSTEIATGPTEATMLEILKRLNPKYCNCPVGAAGEQLGYLCPGTCLDFLYDQGTPFTFAFEIFENGYFKHHTMTPDHQTISEASCFLVEEAAHTSPVSVSSGRNAFFSLQSQSRKKSLKTRTKRKDDELSCLTQFNPTKRTTFDGTIKNWAVAILDLIRHVGEAIDQESS